MRYSARASVRFIRSGRVKTLLETLDIITDIHGQAYKLWGRLAALGHSRKKGIWGHSDPDRIRALPGDLTATRAETPRCKKGR
ncbi:MAG: hypothetical protein OXC72_04315 [Roseovarius sp.]|nr:hypothetical protein [Roseovarius sp.]